MKPFDSVGLTPRWLVAAWSTLAVIAVVALGVPTQPRAATAQAPARAAQPPAEVPRTDDILRAAPFDRITLIDGTVMLVDPVSPRPLPTIDPAKLREIERKKRAKKDPPPREGNIGLPGETSKARIDAEAPEPEMPPDEVVIHRLDGEVRDFKLKRSSIRAIEYFEDLLMAEADRLVLAKDFTRAFECLLRVRLRDPGWRELNDHVNRLLFAEGSEALANREAERGLRLLRELSGRKPDYPGLADKLAGAYGGRARRALELGLFALGRRVLHDAEPLAPGHPELKAVRDQFVERSRARFEAAKKVDGPARLDALSDALRIWPTLDGAEPAYREAFAAWPTLDVAVSDVPVEVGPWVRSPADRRVARLLYRPILAHDDEAAMQGKADGQLAASVTTSDIGRRIVIELRAGASWSDRSRPVGAADLARALTDAAEPTSYSYLGRWADLIDRVDTPDETHVEVRLTRAPVKPGAWLLGPIGPAHAGGDGRVATADGGRALVVDGPFGWSASEPGRLVLEATGERSTADARIRRLRETRYTTAAAALGAFRRGEVALIEHVAPDRVAALTADPEVKVGRYAHPSIHRIALDGRNTLLKNRALRRGLSYAIDRRTLLEESILKRPADDANLVADGVFPRGSYADAPGIKPFAYDPLLARMLVAAARKELNRPLALTFEYPAIPEAQAVAPKLAEAFRLAGVEIKLLERNAAELESELRAGRRFDLAYRADRVDEPAVDAGPLLSPAYDAPPSVDPLGSLASPRILQLLLQLERAPEWPTARGLVIQVDRECRDELPVLPLWQIQDHYAWHNRLKGPAEVAERLYDGIQSWEVGPWFARDPW